ncbi:MAG TPA: helix-turn-helix domain-containing protein [Bacillota bacterium]|nr:helix-turn-helix domain-containing protein [Bacillota bacterium]
MKTLGSRLKFLREKANLTQIRAAQSMDISNVQLSRYESDDRKPEPETLKKISDFYSEVLGETISVDFLLGKTENAGLSDPILEPYKNDKEFLDFIITLKSLPEETQKSFYIQVKAMSEHLKANKKNASD